MKNRFAGERNPIKYTVFLEDGYFNHYVCMAHDGRKVYFDRDDNPLLVVGHMDEFDRLVIALKKLKHMEEET